MPANSDLHVLVHWSFMVLFLMLSSIVPIPKNKLANVANSEHYRGIALSSILDLSMCSDKLCTFSFKWNSLNTLVLKETLCK